MVIDLNYIFEPNTIVWNKCILNIIIKYYFLLGYLSHLVWFCDTALVASLKLRLGNMLKLQWGKKKYLIPCWFCTFAHWQRNDQSIILMVGLF